MAANNGTSPGDPGSMVGVIKTPMCDENVGRKNTPGVKSYKSVTGSANAAASGSNQIEGPGVAGTGGSGLNSPCITIKGSNKKGRY